MSLSDFPDNELLDRREEKAQSLLSNLQGNILKSHGRNFGRHLFFGVRDDVAARKYIADFSRRYVVSAAGQKEQTQRFLLTSDPKDSEIFVNVMISYKGYKAMKIPGKPKDPVFRKGMKEQRTLVGLLTIPVVDFDINIPESNPLGDPPIDKWDEPYQNDFHVAFLLADDKEEELNHFAEKTISEAGENGLQLFHVELGRVIRNDDGNVIEHFGHPDGVSQPIFLRDDFKKWMSQQGITPDRHHPLQHNPQIAHHGNPFAPLSLVLEEDRSHGHLPHHARKEYSFGTYFVYRKLHQLVDEYNSKVQQLATLLQVSEAEADALVIGRDKRGIPLAKQKTEVSSPTVIPNNFDLDNNHHCPFHSHIRKTNPRTSEINIFNEGVPLQRSRRFARRAISYGPDPKNGPTGEDVGLLFMCANSNLAQQFVFMQSFWVNSQNFQKFHTGMDTLLGTRYAHDPPQNQKWVAEHPNRTTAFYFGDVVNMRGGEYFFLPSISTLYHLDQF